MTYDITFLFVCLFSDVHTEAKTSVLENELEACQMLLEEEPDNKCKFLYFYVTVVLYWDRLPQCMADTDT